MQQSSPPVFNLTPRIRLCLSDVVYLESSRNYTFLILTNGKRLLLSKTMGALWRCLPPQQFLRISRTHVINIHHLMGISLKSEIPLALLKTKEELPVSRRRLKAIYGGIYDAKLKKYAPLPKATTQTPLSYHQ